MPEPSSEPRSEVGLVRSTDDAVEGNKARRGKGPARNEPGEREKGRTRSRTTLSFGLARVNAVAHGGRSDPVHRPAASRRRRSARRAFWRQKRGASAGVDRITVNDYERNLEVNLRDLCARVYTGRYRPHPVRRGDDQRRWPILIPITNPIERLNKEVKRRADVAGSFNSRACGRYPARAERRMAAPAPLHDARNHDQPRRRSTLRPGPYPYHGLMLARRG